MNALRWCAALVFLTFSLHAEESYEVRLHRPVKVGEKYNLAAKVGVKVTTRMTMNADDVKEETLVAGCQLLGELKVLATTPKGMLKELRLKIREAESFQDGVKADLFKAGDVILVRHDRPHAAIEVNGEAPTPTQQEIIDGFLYVHGDASATDDELVGTSKKVKPGETWAMNREAVTADWLRDGFEGLKPEHISGSTKLVKIQHLNERPGMSLEGEFKIESTGLRVPNMAEDMQSKLFKMEIKDRTELLLDLAATDVRFTVEIAIESDSSGTLEQDGELAKIRLQVNHRNKAEMVVTPVK
jgi:hypothetical protein